MIKIGYRAHDFGSFDSVSSLASTAHNTDSNPIIQLALKKVVPSSLPWSEWTEDYITSVREELEKMNVKVAIVGCYINPISPDPEKRKNEIERFKKSLSLTKAFGCPYVGTETGTYTPSGGGYSIETSSRKCMEIFKASLSELLDAAEKYDAYVAIEGVSRKHTLSSPERMAYILDSFKTDRLKIIFDPVNLIPYEGIPESDGVPLEIPSEEAERAFVNNLFDIYEGRLVAVHCKDYRLDENGFKIGDIPALTGNFRWDSFACEIRKRGLEDIPWLLENFDPKTAVETVKKLQSL